MWVQKNDERPCKKDTEEMEVQISNNRFGTIKEKVLDIPSYRASHCVCGCTMPIKTRLWVAKND